jgi:hypothetical protein
LPSQSVIDQSARFQDSMGGMGRGQQIPHLMAANGKSKRTGPRSGNPSRPPPGPPHRLHQLPQRHLLHAWHLLGLRTAFGTEGKKTLKSPRSLYQVEVGDNKPLGKIKCMTDGEKYQGGNAGRWIGRLGSGACRVHTPVAVRLEAGEGRQELRKDRGRGQHSQPAPLGKESGTINDCPQLAGTGLDRGHLSTAGSPSSEDRRLDHNKWGLGRGRFGTTLKAMARTLWWGSALFCFLRQCLTV